MAAPAHSGQVANGEQVLVIYLPALRAVKILMNSNENRETAAATDIHRYRYRYSRCFSYLDKRPWRFVSTRGALQRGSSAP